MATPRHHPSQLSHSSLLLLNGPLLLVFQQIYTSHYFHQLRKILHLLQDLQFQLVIACSCIYIAQSHKTLPTNREFNNKAVDKTGRAKGNCFVGKALE